MTIKTFSIGGVHPEEYGEAKATITMHGDSIKGFGWFDEKSRDPITNEYIKDSNKRKPPQDLYR